MCMQEASMCLLAGIFNGAAIIFFACEHRPFPLAHFRTCMDASHAILMILCPGLPPTCESELPMCACWQTWAMTLWQP